MEIRGKRVAKRENLSYQSAVDKIKRVDKEREKYYNVVAAAPWGKAENYDMCFDTARIGMEETADIIVRLVKNVL